MDQRDETKIPDAHPRESWLDTISGSVTVWCLAALYFAISWGPRLLRSFWTDESVTYWTAYKGVRGVSVQLAPLPQFSRLYSLIAALFCTDSGAGREFLLRIPSLVGIAVACFLIYRLAERAIGPGAGLIAAILMLFNRDVLILGSQARPYALAIAAATGTFLCLYEWIETRRDRWLAGYTVSSLLMIYLHFFFGVAFLIHLIWVCRMFVDRKTLAGAWKVACAGLVIGILSLPLVPQLLATKRTADSHIVMTESTFSALRDALMRWEFALVGIIAGLALWYLFPRTRSRITRPGGRLLFLGLTWWLTGPLLLFFVGFFGGAQVFLSRYMAYSFPAQVLVVTWLVWSAFDNRMARIWTLITVFLATVLPYALIATRTGTNELKPFMDIIAAESTQQFPPVFFRTTFTESKAMNWRAGISPDSFLYSPFVAYPMKNQLLPVPFHLDTEALDYIDHAVRFELSRTPEVIWVSCYGYGNAWMIEEMRKAGFHADIRTPNDYSVIIFRR